MPDRRSLLRGLAALPLAAAPAALANSPSPTLAALVSEFERVNREAQAIETDPDQRTIDLGRRPGWAEREARLDALMTEMYGAPVESVADVVTFARFLTCPWVGSNEREAADLGHNLADDILRLHAAGVLHG